MLRNACRLLLCLGFLAASLIISNDVFGPPPLHAQTAGQSASRAPENIALAQAQTEALPSETEAAADPALAAHVEDLIKSYSSTIDIWSVQVSALDQVVKDAEATDEQLRELPGILDGLSGEIREFNTELTPRLKEAQARLKTLGPAAEEGAPEEAAEIAEQRKRQGAEVAAYDGLIKQADVLLVRVGQLIDAANAARRGRFAESLLKPVPNLQSQYFWRRAFTIIPYQFDLAAREISGWLNFAASDGLWRIALLLLAPLAVAALIWYAAKGLSVYRAISGTSGAEKPTPAQRGAAALLGAAKDAAPYLGALATFYLTALASGLITAKSDGFLANASVSSAAAVFLIALVWRSLVLTQPSWRLVAADKGPARRLGLTLSALITIWLADQVLSLADPILFTSYPAIVLRSVVVAALIAALLVALLSVPIGKRRSEGTISYRGWPGWLFLIISLAAALIVLAAIFGYVALALFVATQAVVTAGVLAVMYLLHLTAEHISMRNAALKAESDLAAAGDDAGGPSLLGTLRVLGALLMDVVILIVGVTILLLQWRFDWVEVEGWITTAFVGFKIGGLTISLQAILFALGIFAVGLILTRIVQRWLIRRTLLGRDGDIGLRESLKTGVSYAGFILSAIAAISYLGIGFTNLAIVAGALSLGIGFGLQSIFNNFVSGLILLVERPIKVGDWIEVGAYRGTVKRISVRATEIETAHRESVIVPNANLITDTVTNSMHKDKTCRVDLPVGVSYDTDVELLRQTLLDVAAAQSAVLKSPAPFVYFAGYGESSLDFELRVFLRNVGRRLLVSSELRFAIWFALKDAGITMPFPQRDLHIKDFDMIHAAGAKYARSERPTKESRKAMPPAQRQPRKR
jgi:small-conductance mechanosensitive channel